MKKIISVLAISAFTLSFAQETPKGGCCAGKDKKACSVNDKKACGDHHKEIDSKKSKTAENNKTKKTVKAKKTA